MADNKAKALEAKAKGNAAFSAQSFDEAIKHFTEAIGHDPTDHVFFSNRSACFASLEKFEKALEDGKECVKLKPDWPKGYTRKGLAEFFLEKYDDSADTYKAGLKLSPEDAGMKEGLKKAMDAKYNVAGSGVQQPSKGGGGGKGGGKGGQMTLDPAVLAGMAQKNPKIAEYMKDAALMQKLNMVLQMSQGGNEQMQQQMLMQMMQSDPRLLEMYMALQGIDINSMDTAKMAEEMGAEGGAPKPAPKKAEPEKAAPPPDLRSDETKKADEFKLKGNELYKKKQFAEAIVEYDQAIAAQPNDITYYNNKCAVWIEMGEYDKVLEACKDLVLRRYEINSANPGGGSFEKVAKVFCRMAAVHEKKKDYDAAIEMYEKALLDDNTGNTRNSLRECKKAKDKSEKDAYLDPAKAEAANETAKEFFKNQQWADAKKHYDDAVSRNPKEAKYYSNRAAALTKLLAYPDAIRDLDECLKLDPSFIKAYSRKGVAHFFMKEYHKSLQAYENGLKLDANDEQCKIGRDQVLAKISETSRSGEVDEEQIRHSMADPEIQQILHDPQINQFLKTMKENPAEANKQMAKEPKLQEAVSKLMAAGILRTG